MTFPNLETIKTAEDLDILDTTIISSSECPYCKTPYTAWNGHTGDCAYIAKRKQSSYWNFQGLSDLLGI